MVHSHVLHACILFANKKAERNNKDINDSLHECLLFIEIPSKTIHLAFIATVLSFFIFTHVVENHLSKQFVINAVSRVALIFVFLSQLSYSIALVDIAMKRFGVFIFGLFLVQAVICGPLRKN
jgi:hypothetical protein